MSEQDIAAVAAGLTKAAKELADNMAKRREIETEGWLEIITILQAQLSAAQRLLDEARDILAGLEPHLDAIVCYASTMGEHEPNALAVRARAFLTSEQTMKEPEHG